MKLKDNQYAVFTRLHYSFDEVIEGGKIIFLNDNEEIKTLRRNSRNLRYWDGNNWNQETIRFDKIVDFDYIETDNPEPAFNYNKKIHLLNGNIIKITTSNTSGHITPYWYVPQIY